MHSFHGQLSISSDLTILWGHWHSFSNTYLANGTWQNKWATWDMSSPLC